MNFRRAIATAVLLLAACTESSQREPAWVAKVDGEPITRAQLAAATAPLKIEGLADEERGEAERRILDGLIEQRLLLREAKARGLSVDPREVDAALAVMRAGYPDGTFDEAMKSEGLDETALRSQLEQQLLVRKLLDREVIARVAVTDDELEAWMTENAEALVRPERVRAAQIVVKTEDEARAIHAELKKGAAFDELAKKHSLSPDGQRGGDLGFFARGEMPPPFDEVCFGLRPGQLSDVVISPYGFHVFKLLERKDAGEEAPDYEEIERRVRREKESSAQRSFVEGLKSKAEIVVDEAALSRQMGNP